MGRDDRRRKRALALCLAVFSGLLACSPAHSPASPAALGPERDESTAPRRTLEPGTWAGLPLGPVQPGFDQPTTALSASEILTVPWATIDAPFKQFGIGDRLHHPDLPPPRPYLPGSSTACQAISAVLDHPAEEVDFAPRRFGLYLSGTSFAIGTLPDGLQYYVAAGPPDTSHLDEMQKAGILQNYSGLIVLQVMDNCPFPQFLPEQRWLAAGGIYYYDPTNRGEIVLVGPVSGHVIAYRYKSANGQVDPIIHTFDFETATFT